MYCVTKNINYEQIFLDNKLYIYSEKINPSNSNSQICVIKCAPEVKLIKIIHYI